MPSRGFELVDEIVPILQPYRWVLAGGLMVHAHAALAGLTSERPTEDADVVVEIESSGQYKQIAHALAGIGFVPQEAVNPATPSYRFTRESSEIIDLMVTDRAVPLTFMGRPALQVPASASAMKNTELTTTPSGVEFPIPTLPGALALKGSATETTSPNRIRHFQDGIVLLACADVRGLGTLSRTQRSNTNKLFRGLNDVETWSTTTAEVQLRAIRQLRALRPEWQPPRFLLPARSLRRGTTY